MRFERNTIAILSAVGLAGLAIWLLDVFYAFALIGVAIALLARSWRWRAAGLCFAVGIGLMVPFASNTYAYEQSTVDNVMAIVGFVLVLVALVLMTVLAGRRGLRYLAVIWAVATLSFGIGGFLDSNWASRYDPLGRCFEESSAGTAPTRQLLPPGVRCSGTVGEDFVGANAVDVLILLGYSAAQGLLVSIPLMGLAHTVSHWPTTGRQDSGLSPA